MLEGEAGIGKTTLWRSAVATAAGSYRVLSAQAVAAETELAYSGLTDLLDGSVSEALPSLPRPQRRALEAALLLAEPEGEPPQPRAVAAAFLGVLRLLARERPLLVALDDVHWLDTSSHAVLEYAFRRLEREPIAALVSRRLDADDERSLAFGRTFSDERLTRLRVGGLSLNVLQTLLADRLSLTLTRPTMQQVVDASGGNPFFALELGRALAGRDVPVALGEPLPVPSTLKGLVARRLALLPADTLDALLLTALGLDCTVDLLARALGTDPWDVLRPAVEAEVIEVEGDRVRFTHPLLASVTRAKADPGQRRDVHRRLAKVVADPEQQARHLALGAPAPDGEVAAALDGAAVRASLRGAPAAAAELCELAARLTPPESGDDHAERLIAAAELHQLAGQHAVTRSLLEPLIELLPPGRKRSRALFCLGWAEAIGPGRRLCEEALVEAEGAPELSAAIHHVLGLVELVAGDLAQARMRAVAAVGDARDAGDTLTCAHATALLYLIDLVRGAGPSESEVAWALAREEEADAAPRPTSPSIVHGIRLMYFDRLDEAREAFARAFRRAANRGDEEMVEAALFHSARLECRAGDWGRAVELADQVYELNQRELGHRAGIGAYIRALLAAHQGHGNARTYGAEAIAAAEGLEVRELEARTILGFFELSSGDAAAAVRELEPLPGRLIAMGYGEPSHLQAVPNLIEAYLELGDAARARPLLDWYEQRGRALEHPLALTQAARCHGLLAAADGDAESALSLFGEALAFGLPEPFENGRTLLARGIVLRRMKRRRDARKALEDALGVFDRLGADLWAGRARAELARVAGRPPSGEKLTATEGRVASLVAEGRANKEVAAALFITVKSVEAHLSRIYRKLGIKSRAELMRLYATRGGAQE